MREGARSFQGVGRRSANGCVHCLVGAVTALAAAGCAIEDDVPDIESASWGATVADYETSGCSTSAVLGLSLQIAEEVSCLDPTALVPFSEGGGVVFTGSAVLPYVSAAARDDLLAAVAARGGELRINSGFRTVAQQYLLYQWYQRGRCGIPVAATPGRSNHESGRALDVSNWGEWSTTLSMYGWAQTVPGDEVHFDHTASPDNRGLDVLAFQRLWNMNNPGDVIDEDGLYGPQTGARLAASPAEGFPISGCMPDDPGDPGDPETPGTDAPTGDPLPAGVRDDYASAPDEPDVHGEADMITGGCRAAPGAGGGGALWLLLLATLLRRPALRGRAGGPSTSGRRARTRTPPSRRS